jgi:UPF0755 protein
VGIVFLVAMAGMVLVGLPYYNRLFKPNVRADVPADFLVYLPTGSTFEDVMDSLEAHDILIDTGTFRSAARFHKYDSNVKAGRFAVKPRMTNRELIVSLRSQNVPVRLTINKKRTVDDFVAYIAPKFEFSDTDLAALLRNGTFLRERGFDKANALTTFIPNTYELWWNITETEFYDRMQKEYERFWTDERLRSAASLNLTPSEVITLASIVEEETNIEEEKPVVAGLYLNRIRKGMLLQADPTLRFAVKDFGLQRILNRHKEVESPYNTYKHAGLPPGPICIPAISSIDAVLAAEKHDYIYMCADADFSGRHAFAKTLEQHNQNAAAYQAELNRRGIR